MVVLILLNGQELLAILDLWKHGLKKDKLKVKIEYLLKKKNRKQENITFI